jgi:hypothetical protein
MKYILLMSATKAGLDTHHAWSQKDIETHMAVLRGITNGPDRIRRVCGNTRLSRTR